MSQFKLEDAAPDPAPVTDTTSAAVPANIGTGMVRRPQSLSNAIGTASATTTGSPVVSPTSSITANLRPVSAPFLPHQSPSPTPSATTTTTTIPTEANSDRLSSTTKNNEETNNNDDKGVYGHDQFPNVEVTCRSLSPFSSSR